MEKLTLKSLFESGKADHLRLYEQPLFMPQDFDTLSYSMWIIPPTGKSRNTIN